MKKSGDKSRSKMTQILTLKKQPASWEIEINTLSFMCERKTIGLRHCIRKLIVIVLNITEIVNLDAAILPFFFFVTCVGITMILSRVTVLVMLKMLLEEHVFV